MEWFPADDEIPACFGQGFRPQPFSSEALEVVGGHGSQRDRSSCPRFRLLCLRIITVVHCAKDGLCPPSSLIGIKRVGCAEGDTSLLRAEPVLCYPGPLSADA